MKIQPRRALLPAALIAVLSLGGCTGMPTQREAAATEQLERGRTAWRQGDYEAAVEPLKAAAAQGEIRALYALGYLHFYGQGVPQDRARGIEMIRRAAKAGDALAIEALGVIADARGISRPRAQTDPSASRDPLGPASPGGSSQSGATPQGEAFAPTSPDGTLPDARTGRGQPPANAEGRPSDQPARQGPRAGSGRTEVAGPTRSAEDGSASGESATAADGAAWLRQRDPNHYTVELLAVRDQETVQRYRDVYLTRSPPPEPVQVVEVIRRGRPWLLLVMGDYPDRSAARRVIQQLPPLLRAGKPEALQFQSLSASGPEAALGSD